jgi:porin
MSLAFSLNKAPCYAAPRGLGAAIAALSIFGAGAAFAGDLPSAKADAAAPVAPAADDFWTRPYLFGDVGGWRSYLHNRGIDVSLDGVNETIGNVSGGTKNYLGQASQFGLHTKFDLQQILGWQGGTFGVTLSDRFGNNQARIAGIETLQLTNEVYGRGNIVRLTEFYLQQKLFDDHLEIKVGRLPVGGDFFFQHCDFMNLSLCGGQPGNILGSYIYNWPVSQWGGVVKFNVLPQLALQVGVYDQNPTYLSLEPLYAVLPTFPPHSQGALIPVELQWKPVWGNRPAGDYRLGGWYSTVQTDDVVTSANGLPVLISNLPPALVRGRSGLYFSILQSLNGDATSIDPKHGLSFFVNGAFGDDKTSYIVNQVNVGLMQHGTFDWRPNDEVSLGFSETSVNNRVASAQGWANQLGVGPGYVQKTEYVVEGWYGVQVTGWMNVHLDLQYDILPGGYSTPNNRNAFLIGAKTSINF